MCGFAGFLCFGKPQLDAEQRRAVLRRMGHAIAHRGPDDEQFYDDGTLSLVFRRLSIVDLGGGRQPIFSADGERFVVVNGEIYNHAALRNDLEKRHAFLTQSDSEVPLHLLAERGPEGLHALHGMFAIAWWDRRERRLVLARDRLGIKPLYVVRLPDGLLFGSELKALLEHPRCPRELDWSALDTESPQFRLPVPTYVRGVEHLPAGHHLVATADGTTTRCWWRIDDHLGTARFGMDAEAYACEYAKLLDDATFEHLLSDVPVGLHLSGGLDSALLAAIVAERTKDLACFTVVERTSFRCGDVAAAHETTSALGLPWFPVLFDFRTLLDEMQFDLARLEQSVYMMDAPRFDLEWIFKEELHRAARRQHPAMKVVLLGQGADEFAGGYSRRVELPRTTFTQYLAEEVEPWVRFQDAQQHGTSDRLAWLRRDSHAADARMAPYHRMMRLHTTQLQFHNLWHEDRSSMFQSLEARVPFLDHRLVELLASVPGELHDRLFWNKRIVRDVARNRLPSFDQGHLKAGFFVTGDMRSIDIIAWQMAQRTAPAFFAKYPELEGFPFDVRALRALADGVLARRGAFYRDAHRLMDAMVIAIFAQQCRAPNEEDFRAHRVRLAGPALVDPARWPEIRALFSGEPVIATAGWQGGDRIVVPNGAEILQPATPAESNRFVLTSAGSVCGEITAPARLEWLPRFMRNVGKGDAAAFTVADWEDEFDLDAKEFREVLDTLHQAGFVAREEPAQPAP